MSNLTSTTVACPTCQDKLAWSTENHYRPFCSKRCRMIDLGQWLDGGYSIATDEQITSLGAEKVPSEEK